MRKMLSFLLIITSITIAAQEVDSAFLESFNVRNIGPAGMSGRVTAIDVVLSNPERIFIGTASGGVWKSEDGGIHWEPIFDKVPVLAIGAIKIDQTNPSVIWVGTGEGNPRNSHNSGKGVYKSLDGGKHWTAMGLEETKLIHRILIDPHNPNTVYVGAMGSAWGPNSERGVFKTTDGGKTWDKILYVNDSTGVADMVMDPFNPNKILVAMWEFGRKPWIFNSGGEGSGIYMTHDGGSTWKSLSHKEGLPRGELGRIGLAIARSKPEIIYALIESKKTGLYKSTDGGFHWKLVTTENIGNRPFYYCEIYVDPGNENRIWNLWSYLSKSEDGGKTFETILDYGKGVHPDHHAFWQHPTKPNYIIEGNDGGLNISYDRGSNWRFITNIPVGQFYHINIDTAFPYNVYGGMQDNGSWIGPAYVLKNGGIRNADWREVYFGDGFDVMPRRDNIRYGWAMSQGGNLAYYDKETGANPYVKPVHPEGDELRFNWNAALAQDPFADCGIYYGSQLLHYSPDCGDSWEILSPDLTTNDSTKQLQHKSGGLTIDDTEAENHTTILAIAPSPHDKNAIWVGTDDGYLQMTRDRGETWTEMSGRLTGLPEGSWIPQIQVSKKNPGEVFVVANDYKRNNWSAYLYHSTDYGTSWDRIVDDGYGGGFVMCMVQDPVEPSLLFLGADDGLFFSIDYGETWQKWPDSRFPPVQVRDMHIHPKTHDLVIGTFGRSIWVIDNILPLRELATTSGKVLEEDFHAFQVPDAYLSEYRSVDGIRFIADAEFKGENKRRNADIRVWLKPKDTEEDVAEDKKDEKGKMEKGMPAELDSIISEEKEDKAGKESKLICAIVGARGDTVRQFTREVKTEGILRIGWNLRQNDVRYPTRRDIKESDDAPSGGRALPGDYLVYVTYKDFMDSTRVNVKPDPRLEVTIEELTSKNQILKELRGTKQLAFNAFEQLKKIRANVGLVEEGFAYAPDSVTTKIKDGGKEIRKSLDSLEMLFMLPADTKGYQDDSKTLNSILSKAASYLSRSQGVPGENAMHAFRQAKDRTAEVVASVNTFRETAWQAYMDMVSELDLPLFEALGEIRGEE